MTEAYDIVIVGAGIVGASCALECARSGLRALVLDRSLPGGGTTAAGMGHIVVMDDSEAQFALTHYSRNLWIELRASLPRDVEYDACGTLWLAANEAEMADARRKQEYYEARGVRAEVLDAAEVARLEPNLRAGLAGGVLVPGDAVVYPPCATHFFLEQARRLGAVVRSGVAVNAVLPDGSVQLADGSRIAAGRAVNAAGPWSLELTPGLPVRKRKGHLVITNRAPGFVRRQIVELGYLKSAHSSDASSVAFNIQPRVTGQMLIGSSRQFNAEDGAVDHVVLDRMLRRAIEYLPGLTSLLAIRSWTGHRAATPDKLPLIGPSLASDRVWLATGHEGLGITTSLGTGRLLADMLSGRTPEISPTPFLPARFAWGEGNHE
jgi:glycine/D-amino acid oxidase-like deaminating enzyme